MQKNTPSVCLSRTSKHNNTKRKQLELQFYNPTTDKSEKKSFIMEEETRTEERTVMLIKDEKENKKSDTK